MAADELYGDSPTFRAGVAALDKWYFVEVSCSTHVWQEKPEVHVPPWKGRGRHPTRLRLRNSHQKSLRVDRIVRHLPAKAWSPAKIKEGAKGPVVCEFALLRVIQRKDGLPGDEIWLVLRRNLADPTEVKYYCSNAPRDIEVAELVRISGIPTQFARYWAVQ